EPLLARSERATRRPDVRRRLGHELLRRCGARWAGWSGYRNDFGPDIAPDGVARETQLPRDIADRDPLGQHLVTNDGDELHGNHPWARTPRPLTVQPAPRGWVNFSWPRTPRPLGGGSIPGGRRGSVKMATDTEPHGEPEEPHWEPPEEEEAP